MARACLGIDGLVQMNVEAAGSRFRPDFPDPGLGRDREDLSHHCLGGHRRTSILRQRDVAEKAGIQASTLSLIEGERRRITLDDALALCRGLDVGLADLLTGATTDDLTTLRMTGN